MRVKRFTAPTVHEAMVKVKMDMGKEAVIIHTRKYKEGGFLGFFGKPMVEVTAALEEATFTPSPVVAVKNPPAPQEVVTPQEVIFNSLESHLVDKPTQAANPSSSRDHKVEKELAEMKELMEQISDKLVSNEEPTIYPKKLQGFYTNMLNNEVEEKLAKKLMKSIQNKISAEDIESEEAIENTLVSSIDRIFRKARPITLKKTLTSPHIIALVGPTGVGKTTTIAKLAAKFSISDKKKVALITADTYRIAAVEQLKTFGDIMGIVVDVVYAPEELKKAIAKHSDKDIIIVDTAGRSHKNTVQMAELKNFVEAANPSDLFLVLSSTTKFKDMVQIAKNYEDLQVEKVIFTKLDETSTYGALLNFVDHTKKYLSYITLGQSVPDDIEVASSTKIAQMIVREPQ